MLAKAHLGRIRKGGELSLNDKIFNSKTPLPNTPREAKRTLKNPAPLLRCP